MGIRCSAIEGSIAEGRREEGEEGEGLDGGDRLVFLRGEVSEGEEGLLGGILGAYKKGDKREVRMGKLNINFSNYLLARVGPTAITSF